MKIAGSVFHRNDTGHWGAVLRVAGKRISQEANFETKSVAKGALAALQTELLNGRYLSREQKSVTVAALAAAYGEELGRQEIKSPYAFDGNVKTVCLGPKNRNGVRSGGLGGLPASVLTSDKVDIPRPLRRGWTQEGDGGQGGRDSLRGPSSRG